MTRGICSVGLLVVLIQLAGCRTYDAAERVEGRLRIPERWATEPLRPACYRIEGSTQECFGPTPSRGGDLEGQRPTRGSAPPRDSEQAGAGGSGPEGEWWRSFNDEDLNWLVSRALEESPQARLALARVAQARASRRRSRAGLFPRLDAEFSASRQRQVQAFFSPDAFGPAAPEQAFPETFQVSVFTAQLVGSYELDLFGRVRNEVRAQTFEVEASQLGVADAHLVLAAEVSDAWFELVETRGRADLLRRQLEASRARLQLVQETYEAGLSPSLDVQQQRREVATALARLATVEGAEDAVKSRISALVGVPFAQLRVGPLDTLPEPSPLPALGVPSEAVLRRADVRAARQRLEAADRRVGAAIAQRLPSLRLQGTLGFGSREIESLFDFVIWSVAGTITQPIWHGGDIEGSVDQARAVLDERIAEYRDAVVRAISEVEVALAASNQVRAELEALQAEVQVAEEVLSESELLYRQGLADFLSVIDAERGLHGAELDLLRARRAWLSARVQLHRALGGDVGQTRGAASSRRSDSQAGMRR